MNSQDARTRSRNQSSAGFQLAVSRISNPQAARTLNAPPTGSRRYSRLETCATGRTDYFRTLASSLLRCGKLPLLAGLTALVAWRVVAAGQPPNPLTPQKELTTFRFADKQLTIELVAAEPDITSPVAIAWDGDGRMFVAEMSDYPKGPGTGRIKLLEHRDGDGRYERVTVFADNLPFPSGVLPWRDGVLVTAA